MMLRLMIGSALAIALAGCAGSSGSTPPHPAVPSSPPAASTAAAPAKPDDVVHDLRTGIESPLPDAIEELDGSHYDVSPDGTRLAFDRLVDGYFQVMVASRDGTWARQVTHGRRDSANPRWSPSGDRLVYESGGTIAVTSLTQGRSVRFPHGHGELGQPAFTSDGDRVLFTWVTAKHTSLWTAPSRGGRGTPLLSGAAWGVPSPGGTAIAFHRVQGSIGVSSWGPYQRSLTLVDTDGTHGRPLNGPRGWTMTPVDWSYQRPRWSPDGRMIAYDAGIGSYHWVKVVRVSDGRLLRAFQAESPTWQDDHTLIVERG